MQSYQTIHICELALAENFLIVNTRAFVVCRRAFFFDLRRRICVPWQESRFLARDPFQSVQFDVALFCCDGQGVFSLFQSKQQGIQIIAGRCPRYGRLPFPVLRKLYGVLIPSFVFLGKLSLPLPVQLNSGGFAEGKPAVQFHAEFPVASAPFLQSVG